MMLSPRMRNRLLQVTYRPLAKKSKGPSGEKGLSVFDELVKGFEELEKSVEEKLSPILSEFYD